MQSKGEHIISELSLLSKKLGFVEFGVTAAKELAEEALRYNYALERDYFADMEYLKRNIDKRTDPRLLVENAKSILVFLAPYDKNYNNIITNVQKPPIIASYAMGEDYHPIIKDKLRIILQKIEELSLPDKISGRVFTDSAPILERAWAVEAGMGFIGKNNFLISRKAGLKTFIGIIITDATLPSTGAKEQKKYCGSCTKCLDACPTGALCAPYKLDARRCISYNTIEEKKLAEKVKSCNNEIPPFKGYIFGCDLCLNACPWNRKNHPGWVEFSSRYTLLSTATTGWWEKLTGEEFKKTFATSPLLRTGLENIQASIKHNKYGVYNQDTDTSPERGDNI